MAERGAHTYAEIMSQPSVWATALEGFRVQAPALQALWRAHPPDWVIFTGCGSTYYLSCVGAALFQALTGVAAEARPASEIALFPDLALAPGGRMLLVAVSRSGTTTETLEAMARFRARTGGKIVAITCDSRSPLAQRADLSLAADAAQEASIAQTRSFGSMTVLAQAAAGLLGGEDVGVLAALPGAIERLLSEHRRTAQRLGEAADLERFYFLGSGLLHGVASEAMLKMKEMSLSYSEAFHVLEFRHGPMSMVNDRTLLIGLLSDEAIRHEAAVLREMRDRGARILAIAERDEAGLADLGDVVRLESGLPAWARAVLYLPVLQLLAYYRAMARGQNPDRPANLTAVVELESLSS